MTTSALSNALSNSLLLSTPKQQPQFMFTPPPPSTNTNSNNIYNLFRFMKTADGDDISYIVINPDKKKSNKYIIFAHDNNSDIITMYDFAKNWSNQLTTNVVLFDYPGYGLSKGSPSENNCYDSIIAIVNEFTKKISPKNIILVGHALGAGVIIEYVYKTKWTHPIILISPYKSILYESEEIFKTLPKLNNIECPIKLFHSDMDNVVNISHSKEIYKQMRNKKLDPTWFSCIGHHKTLENIDLNIIKYIIGN